MLLRIKAFLSNKLFVLMSVPLLFLIAGIVTLPDYGINWDSFVHFSRGQSYLNYFLTGKKNYNDLPPLTYTKCNSGNSGLFLPKCPENNFRRSYYQNDYYNYEFWVVNDSGHPPLNDILAATSNYIFYQKLGILGDDVSHHLFIVFSSFVLITAVAFFVFGELGMIPAITSSIILSAYPLFFSESHFNIKDPPEAVFFGLTLIFFYWGIVKNKWQYILLSSIAAGLALGTKLNIVFAAAVAGIWLCHYLYSQLFPKFSLKKTLSFFASRKNLLLSLFIYLPVSFGIVYALWPYLWNDTLRHVFSILGYYSQIGTGTPADVAKYIFHGWDLYPAYWIVVTTPVFVLAVALLGIVFVFLSSKFKKLSFSILILFWFLIPIIRASWPNAVVYGGVRQIMEFVPAMAVLSGMGVYLLIEFVKKNKHINLFLIYLFVISGLSFSIYETVAIHPNENIYFNQLVGGLSGASKINIPYWGNTYGTIYLEGVRWLNSNAEKGAKIALPIGVMSNISHTAFKTDLDYSKPNWSGPKKAGEYGIEMYFDWPAKYWYSFQYYDQYLEPVYVYSVDGIPLLKIWKNDLLHTKEQFKQESVYSPQNTSIENSSLGPVLKIDMGKNIYLTKLNINHSKTDCQNGPLGYVALSVDGKKWDREPEPINSAQVAPGVDEKLLGYTETNFVYLFAGKKARYIMLDPQIINSCYLKNFSVEVSGLSKLP